MSQGTDAQVPGAKRETPARTILVVDDSRTIRQQTRVMLESDGFTVIEASNGVEGIEQARKSLVDLVIVDVNMPVMGGLEMITQVRQLAGYATVPIFVLTTEASGEIVRRGKAAGATAWVVKPFKAQVLLPAIRGVLKL
jgi:two-component system, chemotaxis family, chemotaxis protein CheY